MNYNNINNNLQNYNVYPPQHNMPIPQVKKDISQPVTTNTNHPTLEEPPDNMRKRGKILNLNANISSENFNNTMPNLRPNAELYNNIPISKQEKNNYLIQPSFGMTFDGKNKNENINSNASIVMNKRTKIYISNVPQKINAFSFSSSKPTQNNNVKINQNMINNNNIVKENNNINNYQNKPQIQKNNKIIINSNKPENVEYRDQYGNILVNINGKLIDKRLLINSNPNPNPNINKNNMVYNNTNMNQEKNNYFQNTYPLPGQKAYSTQTLINNNIEQNNINQNININNNNYPNQNQNQNYSQRTNRFLEDQNNNNNINLINTNQQNDLSNDINNLFKKSNSHQLEQPEVQVLEVQKPKKRRPVFKIPPSKKRSISQGRSLAFIHKYYDENFILEEDNEDNASDSENKKTNKKFKNVAQEVINIKKLIPNQENKEEEIDDKINNNNSNISNNSNKEELINNNNMDTNININIENQQNIENNENNEIDNNNNLMRLSHMGFSLERSSFIPENEKNQTTNTDDLNKDNNNSNNDVNDTDINNNIKDLNIDQNIYEEKKIDLDLDEENKKIRRNIDINMDDDNINIDKINEELNEKIKIYTDKEKQQQSEENDSIEQLNNISKKESEEIENSQINTQNKNQSSKISNPSFFTNENILNNNSSISQNLLRDSDISNINPKFYEPVKDSIVNLRLSDINNNATTEKEDNNRINMNIEGHDLDKYFPNENMQNDIKKKEIDSSLRTLNSEGENRNSQQIVDNLDEAEEENNDNLELKKSEEINLDNNEEKLTTINDVITESNFESKNSKNLNDSEKNVK